MRKLTLLIVLLVMITSTVACTKQTEVRDTRPEQNFLAPDFQLTNSQGEVVQLAKLQGKPVFINFWASWCPPCKAEMPVIQTAYEKYKEEIVFISINVTIDEQSKDDPLKFLQDGGYTFPVYWDDADDIKKTVAYRYLIRSIPTSFFIDKSGMIKYKVIGAVNEAMLEQNLQGIIKE